MMLGQVALLEAFDKYWSIETEEGALDFDEISNLVSSNSVDVRLGRHFFKCEPQDILITEVDSLIGENVEVEDYQLIRGEYVLGVTMEAIQCNHPLYIQGRDRYFAPMYDGRSTCGRLGLTSHMTAGFGDYGFKNPFTLELQSNWHTITLMPGMRIGQISFVEVEQPLPYPGEYNYRNWKPLPPILGHERFFI